MRNLDETEKEGKYSLGEIESYFTLFELLLAPKSNSLLAVKELHFLKQGSMNSGEFHFHVTKIAKRCQFPNAQAEERTIRDAIFLGMNSQKARDKAINLMNEEGKVLTVDLLMNQLEIEDCNSHHKRLSQLDSTSSVNFAAYNHRQNKGRKSRKNRGNGKNWAQNKSGEQGSSNSGLHSSLRDGGEVHEMWKTRSPARTKVSSQECQVQGMSQNRTLSQSLPKQEKSHPEGSLHHSSPK